MPQESLAGFSDHHKRPGHAKPGRVNRVLSKGHGAKLAGLGPWLARDYPAHLCAPGASPWDRPMFVAMPPGLRHSRRSAKVLGRVREFADSHSCLICRQPPPSLLASPRGGALSSHRSFLSEYRVEIVDLLISPGPGSGQEELRCRN